MPAGCGGLYEMPHKCWAFEYLPPVGGVWGGLDLANERMPLGEDCEVSKTQAVCFLFVV